MLDIIDLEINHLSSNINVILNNTHKKILKKVFNLNYQKYCQSLILF